MRTKANFRFNLGILIALILVMNLSAEGAEATSAKVSEHKVIKTLVLIYNPVLVGQENKRLTEFMELCQSLKKLKDNGTLDAISETIIKLMVGGRS